VLDTWFSSALWPHSTMGWPDPASAASLDPDAPDDTADLLRAFNPTSVLTTAREIITLWVSRMVMFNRYFLGQDDDLGAGKGRLPFDDVFIHAMIQDGEGRKMSKSLGNGVDPFDIIDSHGADAMRFTLAKMTTQTQDVRMPVVKDEKTGKNTSPKFDEGRNFCNKLWNAARFTLTMLDKNPPEPARTFTPGELSLADRWMLSRLETGAREIAEAISAYQFSAYAQSVYDLLWRDFCDWYLEAIKPQVASDAGTRATLRFALDAILRLLHPITPFVTEAIHERLRDVPMSEIRGVGFAPTKSTRTLCQSGWPELDASVQDEGAEGEFEWVRSLVRSINETRAAHKVEPRRKITLHAPGAFTQRVEKVGELIRTLAGLETITGEASEEGAVFTFESSEWRLTNLADAVDAAAERERLSKRKDELARSIAGLTGRLSNPGYTEKAPAHLVQQTRDELASLQEELAAVDRALDGLG
ncbi:MAG: class I tRNA ligase family protein, partial [Phycisphaerales bacterium JB059]